jgi:CRISPR-associated protein Csm5
MALWLGFGDSVGGNASMSENNYDTLQITVMTLTPLHIGTGRELMQGYDYCVHNKQTWRLNEDAILHARFSDDPREIERLAKTPLCDLLNPDDFKPTSDFFRYVIPGQPRSTNPGSILREQIKSARDEVFLPGSSLKGALRTIISWQAWRDLKLQPDRAKLDNRPKFAARNYEREIFGGDPNHDLLRALQVSDSAPIAPDCLMLANVKVLMAGKEGSPIEVEAIRKETRFKLSAKIDPQLFSEWAGKRNNFRLGGAQSWLENLVAIGRAHAQERIRVQRDFYEKRANGAVIADFYRKMERLALKDGQFLVQLGWGGGWDSKTFGSRLTANDDFKEWLIQNYRMGKGTRQKGDPFPRSRRAAVSFARDQQGRTTEKPGAAMGWVLVEMKARD